MEDGEFRQAMAVLESYNLQLETISRQVRLLQVSLEETTRARESLKALNDAKEGDEILIPVGASAFVPVRVTGEKKALINIGNRISAEKSIDESIAFMETNGKELSEALRNAIAALEEIETRASELSAAIQNEYQNRQDSVQ
jgi:prefoldin, archaeal alpha subunit/eukaryotic subunit 5